MNGLALQHSAASDRADERAIAHCDFAAHSDSLRPSFKFPALERAVIDVHRLRLCRDGTAIFRVVDDEISIRADLDCAFARKQSKHLRRVRAGYVNKGMQIELAGLDSMREEEFDALFQRRNAVRNFREIIA